MRKDPNFHIFIATCLTLSLLSWGVSIYKKPNISGMIEQAQPEQVKAVKAEASPEKIVVLDTAREESCAVSEIKYEAGNENTAIVEHLAGPDIAVSQSAGDEIAKIGEPAVPGLLNELRASADVGLRGEVIFLLGRIASKEAVNDLLLILDDENAYIRRNAAEALGKIKDGSAAASLARLLFDEDVCVREQAARALGEINSPGAGTSILEHIREEKEECVKSAMVEVIGKLKDQSATLTLLDELKAQNNQLYKNKVAFSLGELKNPQALEDLNCYLNGLKEFKPAEPMMIPEVNEAISIAQEAITKINAVN